MTTSSRTRACAVSTIDKLKLIYYLLQLFISLLSLVRYRTLWQGFFMRPNIKKKTKFCVSFYHQAHAETKRSTLSKFGTEILDRVFENISKRFSLD